MGHFFVKFFFQFFGGDARVFHRVVQQAGANGFFVHFKIQQDLRHRTAVVEIRLSGFAFLVFVGVLGKAVGFLQHGRVGVGVVFFKLRYQFAQLHKLFFNHIAQYFFGRAGRHAFFAQRGAQF